MPHPVQDNNLKKILGVAFGISIVIGGTIGVGILRTPSIIAGILPDPFLIILCWILVGIYIMLSASSYAELTTMMPKAGGAYNYIKRAFGDYAGFVNGWFDFISNAMAPAYFCIVLSEYTALLYPGAAAYSKWIALLFLSVFTLINLPGTRSGSTVQKISSSLKVLLFLILIAGCFYSGRTEHLQSIPRPVIEGGIIFAVFRTLQLIMGSYDGWMAVSFFAEEDGNPARNIPRSYLLGALSVTIIYVLINAAILYVLPVSVLSTSTLAASDAASVAFGSWSTDLIIIIAIFSLFSILNAYMMIPSRILFGLSRDRFFISQGMKVNNGGTPYISLVFCYCFAAILIFASSFEQLFSLGAFMLNIVTGFSFASLIRLRRAEPDLARPYKAWGYPFSTWLALLVTIALLTGFAFSDRDSLIIILIIIAVLFAGYRLFYRNNL